MRIKLISKNSEADIIKIKKPHLLVSSDRPEPAIVFKY